MNTERSKGYRWPLRADADEDAERNLSDPAVFAEELCRAHGGVQPAARFLAAVLEHLAELVK